jgi:hypothetical protein
MEANKMRNLKRTLALLVTLVMCAGFIALPAFAAACPECDEDPCICPNAVCDKCDKDPCECPADGTVTWDGLLPALSAAYVGTAQATQVAAFADGDALTTAVTGTVNISTGAITVGGITGFAVAGWTLDGRRWTAATSLDEAALAVFLKKGGALRVTNALSDDSRPVPVRGANAAGDNAAVSAAIVVTFATLEKAPRAPRLAINYLPLADNSGLSLGAWTLSERGERGDKISPSVEAGTIQVVLAGDDRKNPAEGQSFATLGANGIAVLPMPEDGRPGRNIYLFREVAYTETSEAGAIKYFPASGTGRITASTAIRAPRAAVNYKNSTIRPRAGMMLSLDPVVTSAGVFVTDNTQTGLFNPANLHECHECDEECDDPCDDECDDPCEEVDIGNGAPFAKGAPILRAGVPFPDLSTSSTTPFAFFAAATNRRPQSVVQVANLAQQAQVIANVPTAANSMFSAGDFSVTAGKVSFDRKVLEFTANPITASSKWGGFPRVSANNTLVWVRVKSDARHNAREFGPGDPAQRAASEPVLLIVAFGNVSETDRVRNGVQNVMYMNALRAQGLITGSYVAGVNAVAEDLTATPPVEAVTRVDGTFRTVSPVWVNVAMGWPDEDFKAATAADAARIAKALAAVAEEMDDTSVPNSPAGFEKFWEDIADALEEAFELCEDCGEFADECDGTCDD